MKKITLIITFLFALFSTNQSLGQLDVANWPNPDWTISGTYTTTGFTNDPRTTSNFTYDDDLAGSGSLFDDIAAESPAIDLNPAIAAGELQIKVSLTYIYKASGDTVTLEWWNQDLNTWLVWEQFSETSTSETDYKNCAPLTAFTSTPLTISTFTATQLLGFKYRLRFNDNGFNFGVCFGSPTLDSIVTSSCLAISSVVINPDLITETEAVIDWTENNSPPPVNGWEIEYGPVGFTQGTGTTLPVALHPFTLTGLTISTSYDVYIRALCSATDQSDWTGPINFTTLSFPGGCGGQFVDSGGLTGDYSNNENIITTICPDETGDVVTINFLSFDTESCCDDLSIYDGPDTSSPLLGVFAGTDLPPTFTSTHATGCLTFVFDSDGSIVSDGWVANIICSPPPTCFAPNNLVVSSITESGATIVWNDTNSPPAENGWEVEIVQAGTTPTGVGVAATSPYIATGLDSDTTYDFYVRAVCDDSGNDDPSFWVTTSFTTLVAPPACGGIYVDNGGSNGDYSNNTNETFTICPDNSGDVVTLQFLEFNTELNYDYMLIYNGPDTSSPLFNSGYVNPGFGVAPNGSWTGNGDFAPINISFISSDSSGCLTVVFSSDNIINNLGWTANVICAPPPTCFVVSDITISNIDTTSAQINWVDNNPVVPVGGWDVEYDFAGFIQGTGLVDTNVTNPHTITGLVPSTNYDVYVRANCASDESDSSLWVGPVNLRTDDAPPPNDTCITAIPLVVGSDCQGTLGNNILATESSDLEGEILPDCADPAANGVGAFNAFDVWFTFVVPSTGTVIVQTDPVNGGMVDTVMSAYTGTCGNLVELKCNGDSVIYPYSDNNRFSSFELQNYTPGETIYLRVWSYDDVTYGNVQGAFNICVYGQSRAWNSALAIEDEIDVINDEIQISYYPNPVDNVLTVKANKEIYELAVYSLLGQQVMKKSYSNLTNVTLNMQELSFGTYFVKALVDGKIKTFKVIKK